MTFDPHFWMNPIMGSEMEYSLLGVKQEGDKRRYFLNMTMVPEFGTFDIDHREIDEEGKISFFIYHFFSNGSKSTPFYYNFLTNGALDYIDLGNAEYSTPECTSPRELLIHERFGSLYNAKRADRKTHEFGLDGIRVYKSTAGALSNSVESTSQGYHENMLVPRHIPEDLLIQTMLPLYVARTIMTGDLGLREDGLTLSNRAQHVRKAVSGCSTSIRPIYHVKDEALADRRRFRRLHTIVGDAHMSDYSIVLPYDLSLLVLAAVDKAFCEGDTSLENLIETVSLDNSVASIRRVAGDIYGEKDVKTRHGNNMRAVDILETYLRFVEKMIPDMLEASPLFHESFERVSRVTGLLQNTRQNQAALSRLLDPYIKLRLLDSLTGLRPAQKMVRLHSYHAVNPGGLFYKELQAGNIETLIDNETLRTAIHPPETRAKPRARIARLVRTMKKPVDINWNSFVLCETAQQGLLLDPRSTKRSEAFERYAQRHQVSDDVYELAMPQDIYPT